MTNPLTEYIFEYEKKTKESFKAALEKTFIDIIYRLWAEDELKSKIDKEAEPH